MTSLETTNYLKTVAELEASVYRQEKMIESCQKEMNNSQFQPVAEYIIKPVKYQNQNKPTPPTEKANYTPFYIMLAFAGVMLLLGIVLKRFTEFLFISIGIVVVAFICKAKYINPLEEEQSRYQRELEAYKLETQKKEDDYKKSTEEYKRKKANADSIYKGKLEKYNEKKAKANTEIDKLKNTVQETKATLSRLYALEVIFPKYRNLVAMNTIYEYFASERCSELTGPNGAYNLFEAELRQNIIITKLDNVISQLEEIKQNQYILYKEMKQTNEAITAISQKMDRLMKTAKNIELSSYISSQCAQITAKNTEALKYISLING